MRRQRSRTGLLRAAALLAAIASAPVSPPAAAEAVDLQYVLEVLPGEAISYAVPIAVDSPGNLTIDASWPGARILSFRLEPPAGSTASELRRSGPSPQRIEAWIDADDRPGASGRWTLSIRGNPGRGGGEGRLLVKLPAPEAEALPEPQVILPEPDVARHPDASPSTLRLEWRPLDRAVRGFDRLLDETPEPDSCRWQEEFRQWVDSRLDLLEAGGSPLPETRRALEQIVEAIDRVNALQDPADPILAGPAPEDRSLYRAWTRARRSHLESIHATLDAVAASISRGLAPELDGEPWPARLVACVTACQRHFEQRAEIGAREAVNYDLARAQWDRVRAASATLDAYAALPETGAVARD